MVMSVANILKVKGRIYKTVGPDETVREFAEHLREERIGAMIVTRDGITLDGIISERDIANGLALHGEKLPSMKVSKLMTKVVVVCSPDDSIDDVMNLMTQHRIRHLPAQDKGELVGIVTIGDVVKAHLVGAHLTSRVQLARSA
jgi:CBS domain-containing protein